MIKLDEECSEIASERLGGIFTPEAFVKAYLSAYLEKLGGEEGIIERMTKAANKESYNATYTISPILTASGLMGLFEKEGE